MSNVIEGTARQAFDCSIGRFQRYAGRLGILLEKYDKLRSRLLHSIEAWIASKQSPRRLYPFDPEGGPQSNSPEENNVLLAAVYQAFLPEGRDTIRYADMDLEHELAAARWPMLIECVAQLGTGMGVSDSRNELLLRHVDRLLEGIKAEFPTPQQNAVKEIGRKPRDNNRRAGAIKKLGEELNALILSQRDQALKDHRQDKSHIAAPKRPLWKTLAGLIGESPQYVSKCVKASPKLKVLMDRFNDIESLMDGD